MIEVTVSHTVNLRKCIRVGCNAKRRRGIICTPDHIRFRAQAKKIIEGRPMLDVYLVNGVKMGVQKDTDIAKAIAFMETYVQRS